ncbi:porin [Rhizobium mesosinicum]|uniref:Porin n=1 Tax=Rhizobium mesosinicum TaxID=335017 RepID=A0ABS7GMA0_9HYPH|nr:porin [Rhizobium mesosinicum]MBW9051105.1 porin [Rhizobium mesosinicum]
MKLKMVLVASVAALAATSGVQAADAIVAAQPEPVEYVRVCDAYGTGFFYIPGSDTCLKIGGYIRTEARFGPDLSGTSDWSLWTRGQVTFTSKSDTEWGALTGVITLRTNAENASQGSTFLNEGYIDIAGLRVGMQYSWWDDDPSGETDLLATNDTRWNAIRYQYETDSYAVGVSLDELEDRYAEKPGEGPNNFGVSGQVSAKMGAFSAYVLGGYDTDNEEGAVRAIVNADVGPGVFTVYGVWASGANYYYETSEWSVGTQYELAVNDKLSVTPGFQYFGKIDLDADGSGFHGGDAWTAGLTVDYQIVSNLATKVAVNYHDEDDNDFVDGFVRLQRSF